MCSWSKRFDGACGVSVTAFLGKIAAKITRIVGTGYLSMAVLALNRVSSCSKKLRKEPKATVLSLNFPHASKVMDTKMFCHGYSI